MAYDTNREDALQELAAKRAAIASKAADAEKAAATFDPKAERVRLPFNLQDNNGDGFDPQPPPLDILQEKEPSFQIVSSPPEVARSAQSTTDATTPGNGGFDWARGLYAFGGGNPADIDAMRAAPTKLAGEKAELADKDAARRQLLGMRDPNSAQSKAAQQRFSTQMLAYAGVPGVPDSLKQVFERESVRAPSLSAAEIDAASAAHQSTLGNYLKALNIQGDAEVAKTGRELQAHGLATQDRLAENTIKNTENDNALQWAKFHFEKNKSGIEKMRLHLNGDQQKLVGELAGDLNQIKMIDQMMPQADEYAKSASSIPGAGKSGIISGRVQTLRSMANPSTDKKFNEFRANVQRAFSVERKFFAGVAVTPSEMENLAPMIPDFNKDSEETIRDKLQAAKQWLQERTDTNMSRLQYDAVGNPIDQSLLVKMLSATAPVVTAQHPAIKQQIERQTSDTGAARAPQVGQIAPMPDPAMVERAKKAAANGNAKAAQWLKDNGYAP